MPTQGSLRRNVRSVMFSESVLTVEGDICLHGPAFKLTKQDCVILSSESEQALEKNGFMLLCGEFGSSAY